jgi:outer membrane protein OmpA-like peptidoglycan-associated protein
MVQLEDRLTAEKFRVSFSVRMIRFITFFLILILFSGCSPKTQFVLLPDPDGHVGKIEVANPQGMRVLDKPWQATEVKNIETIPGEPEVLDEAQVRRVFKDALAAQPQPPVTFLMYFKSESSVPLRTSLESLPKIMEAIQSRKSQDISVVGHTDSLGTDDYNLNLSMRRAKRVAELLIAEGVDPSIIEIDYFGKEKPLTEAPEGVPEPRNRRVEITVR